MNLPEGLTSTESKVYLLVKKYLNTHVSVTANIVSKLIGKSSPTARKYLSLFVSLGLMEAHGSNKNRTYTLIE